MTTDFVVEAIHVDVDTSVFAPEALMKCVYWYGGQFDVFVERGTGSTVRVTFRHLHRPMKTADWDDFKVRFRRDLIDFQTRHIVSAETQVIRELIIAKAFARIDPFPIQLNFPETDPPGFNVAEFNDPQAQPEV